MTEEKTNYIEYRTLCPVPYECLTKSEIFTKQNVVENNREDISLEKKQAVAQLVAVLQKVNQRQQAQHRELIFMMQKLNAAKKAGGSTNPVISHEKKTEEETAEDKLRKAEKRVQELEALLKKMETEKKQSANVVQNGSTAKNINVVRSADVRRQNQTKIASLKNPYIGKKGVMFKKVTVTWNTIYFGSYPQIKETLLKSRMETDAFRDEKGNYIYGNGQYARKFRKTIREYYEYQPIRWRVLHIENGIATLFADQILDVMPYDKTITSSAVTWEGCSLRRWLNEDFEGSFYQLAFSEEEKAAIVHGLERQDKVTLLRHVEILDKSYESYGFYDLQQKGNLYIESLFPNAYTDYVDGKAIFRRETAAGRTGSWWLKDTVANGKKALEVNASGYIGAQGTNVDVKWIGVRPIIVVDLNKLNAVIKTGNPVEAVRG